MIFEINIEKEQINEVKDILKDKCNIDTISYWDNIHHALCSNIAKNNLNLAIEMNDEFISEEYYDYALIEIVKDLVENFDEEFVNLEYLAYDLACDYLKQNPHEVLIKNVD